MLKRIRERLAEAAERAEGFTLIELMVVVLIIAILIAIAIPTFLGARERAQNRAAQSNLRNALTAEETNYTDGEQYSNVPATMQAIEGSIAWVAAGSTANSGEVAISTGAQGVNANAIVCLYAHSSSGKDYAIKKIATGANASVQYKSFSVPGACDVVDAAAVAPALDVWTTDFQ